MVFLPRATVKLNFFFLSHAAYYHLYLFENVTVLCLSGGISAASRGSRRRSADDRYLGRRRHLQCTGVNGYQKRSQIKLSFVLELALVIICIIFIARRVVSKHIYFRNDYFSYCFFAFL